MKKKLISLLAVMLIAALITGCAVMGEERATVRIAGLKGATTIGMVKLLDDAKQGTTKNDYEFLLAGSADEITPKLIRGELDMAALPVNLGSILYNNTNGGVTMLAVNTLGVIYVVEKGAESVKTLADLKGKTIYATGRGSTPEYALTYLLSQAGLSIDKDVTVEWRSEPTEVVALMAAQETAIAMLPQPYITSARAQLSDLRVALDLTEIWDSLNNGSRFITAGVIVRTEFLREHPQAVADFLKEYNLSTQYVNQNVADAAKLVGEYGIVNAAVAEKAIPELNIVCIAGTEMREALSGYLQILYDFKPASVGGALPGEDFYYADSAKE